MKRRVIIFLAFLLTTITCTSQVILNGISSDSIVLITSSQLKETNLIFAEHRRLLKENELLYKQIENYKSNNQTLMSIDSLRSKQIENFKLLSKSYKTNLDILNNKIKKKERALKLWRSGGVTVSTVLLLFLILK